MAITAKPVDSYPGKILFDEHNNLFYFGCNLCEVFPEKYKYVYKQYGHPGVHVQALPSFGIDRHL